MTPTKTRKSSCQPGFAQAGSATHKLRHLFTSFALAVCALSLSSCGGDSHDALVEDMLGFLDKTAKAISDVSDEASAKKAGATIEGMKDDLDDLVKRAEALGKPSDEDKTALVEAHKERAGEIMGTIMAKMLSSLENAEVMKPVEDAMDSLESQMNKFNDLTGDLMNDIVEAAMTDGPNS